MLLEGAGYDETAHDTAVAFVVGLALPAAIRSLADDYIRMYGLGSASGINAGMCGYFAGDIAGAVTGCRARWGDEIDPTMPGGGSHCVIVRGGRYYDAECPDGVDEVWDIPYFVEFRAI